MALSDDQITQIRATLQQDKSLSLLEAEKLLAILQNRTQQRDDALALVDQLRSERDAAIELERQLWWPKMLLERAQQAEASLARLRTALEGLAERWDEDAKGATGFPSACAGELRDALASTRPDASPKESTTP